MMKAYGIRPSLFVLAGANLAPVFGVLYFHWQVFPILFLFWSENVVIGVINVFKMIFSEPGDKANWAGKLFMIPFFSVHYGMFCLVHGVFIIALFGHMSQPGVPSMQTPDFAGVFREYQLGWAFLVLAASHVFSFITNYLGAGEFRRTNVGTLLFQPYGRVVVLHLTILVGAFLISKMGTPVVGLLLLVVLKTGLDAFAHLRERRKFSPAPQPL